MESDVMDAEGSLHQKPSELSISEDTESVDLGVLREHEAESCEEWHSMFVTGGRSRL